MSYNLEVEPVGGGYVARCTCGFASTKPKPTIREAADQGSRHLEYAHGVTRYEMRPGPEGPVCDFCSSKDVRWSFPCRDHVRHQERAAVVSEFAGGFDVNTFNINSSSAGNWAACPACKALIQRGEREKLARRSAKRMKLPDGFERAWPLEDRIEYCRRTHDQFWSNREGPPRRIEAGDAV